MPNPNPLASLVQALEANNISVVTSKSIFHFDFTTISYPAVCITFGSASFSEDLATLTLNLDIQCLDSGKEFDTQLRMTNLAHLILSTLNTNKIPYTSHLLTPISYKEPIISGVLLSLTLKIPYTSICPE